MRAAIAVFALLSVSSMAQTPAVSKSFVIADVRPSPFSPNPFMHGNSIQKDRYFLTQATMIDLIATAYRVDAVNVQGGPTPTTTSCHSQPHKYRQWLSSADPPQFIPSSRKVGFSVSSNR